MARPPHDRSRIAVRVIALLAAIPASGCVTMTVYQPMVSLQRPVVVDDRVTNFEGMRLLIRCDPADSLPPHDAEILCSKVGNLFSAQGAEVDQELVQPGGMGVGSGSDEAGAKKPDLTIDLVSHVLPSDHNGGLMLISLLSFTFIPAVTEYRFSQDVAIRDSSGFLIGQDRLEGRFVEYFGAGFYAVNWVVDLALRSDEDDLTGDAAKRDFSKDFYGQMSQLVFNARVRSQLLHGFQADAAAAQPPKQP